MAEKTAARLFWQLPVCVCMCLWEIYTLRGVNDGGVSLSEVKKQFILNRDFFLLALQYLLRL